jgi:hypothetical protein
MGPYTVFIYIFKIVKDDGTFVKPRQIYYEMEFG